jgi:hypothetical protein
MPLNVGGSAEVTPDPAPVAEPPVAESEYIPPAQPEVINDEVIIDIPEEGA